VLQGGAVFRAERAPVLREAEGNPARTQERIPVLLLKVELPALL
jgi:hypothetical protein